jgi:hypothetical protein
MQRAKLMLPGYEGVELQVDVKPDSVVNVPKVRLHHTTGRLMISSKPPNATFELRQGEEVARRGTLPVDIPDAMTGAYTLVARLDGREKSMELNVQANESLPVEVEFLSGKLAITSEPTGAEIYIAGEPKGSTPLELSLPKATYDVVAKYRSWPEQHATVAVAAEQPTAKQFEFIPGSVKIASRPGSGATVRANNRDLGVTTLLLENIEPGPVRYTLLQTGFEPLEVTGEVKPGEQTFLSGVFRKRIGPQLGKPWENSLGMKFVPVGDVLVSVWPTRVKDFDAFCAATNRQRQKPDFPQDANHPVVLVNY